MTELLLFKAHIICGFHSYKECGCWCCVQIAQFKNVLILHLFIYDDLCFYHNVMEIFRDLC